MKIKGAATKLEKAVQAVINQSADGNAESWLNDLMRGGCQSGMVGSLIYYTDTVKFYKAHRDEISAMLGESCEDTGCSPAELFGDKWEKEDPLATYQLNQNLLAWFGFEETARILADRNGIEI